jgi:hypothetical protein
VKRLANIVLPVSIAITGTILSFGGQAAQEKKLPPPPPYFEVVQGLYINQLQQFMELTDDQYLKVATLMKDFLRRRYEIEGPGRTRALNQLRQGVNRGASDEQLVLLTQEFDRIEGDVSVARQEFLTKADPLLQIRQRAKLRLYMVNKDTQLLRLIQAAQNPATIQKPEPNPPTNQKPLPN